VILPPLVFPGPTHSKKASDAYAKPRNPNWGKRISKVDLLELTSSDNWIFKMELYFFYRKLHLNEEDNYTEPYPGQAIQHKCSHCRQPTHLASKTGWSRSATYASGMREIGFLTYPVPLKWTEQNFKTVPSLFNLIWFHWKIPVCEKMNDMGGTDR
jgi:hypothetical protein